MDNVKKLTRELWELINTDDGETVRNIRALKKKEDRRGRVKRLLCKAIDKSSLGTFNNLIYFFAGKVYEPIGRSELFKCLYNIIANFIELPDSDLSKLSDLYYDCLNAVYAKLLAINNSVMVFRNGVLDVEHGEFHRKFDRRFVQMWAVDYDYNPEAKTFLFYQFINQVLPDRHLQDMLQMFLGATFVDRKKVKIEHLVILLGKGSNGKSVIQQVVRGVLGDEYVSTMEVGRLCSRGNDGDSAVAEINGKRLNYCTEMEQTDFYKKSARLKAIISGEKVPARRLYGFPFYATNIPLLMANANAVPVFNRKDDALVRRIYVIPFNVVIPPEHQNKTLNDELVDEYPAILNWILEGRDKFINNNYCLPEAITYDKIVEEDRRMLNSAIKFMSLHGYKSHIEGVEVAPVTWKTLTELYRHYERWCDANGLMPMGKGTFSNVLVDDGGFRRERKAKGMCFAIFGDTYIAALKREQRQQRMKERQPRTVTFMVGGKLYASSLKALSEYAGVSFSTIQRANREGRFKEYTKAFREKSMYDIEGCTDVLRRLLIIASDAQKEVDARIRKELKYLRYTFNQRMEYNGLPYRKYSNEMEQIDNWCKVVPDETTDEEVYKMALEAGYDLSRWDTRKTPKGVHSKGGKGFFASTDEIPTEEEKQLINNIKNENHGTEEEEGASDGDAGEGSGEDDL